jgi:general secretion pathway protein C
MMKKTFTIISILLLIVAICFGVNALYEILTSKMDKNRQYKPSEDQVSPSTRGKSFDGKDESGQKLDDFDTEGIPETKLNLKLWGTVIGGVEKPYAVIEETQLKKQNLYREGDTIQDTLVKRILREKVVLHINGRDEILSMQVSSGAEGESAPTRQLPEPMFLGDTADVTIERSNIDAAIEGRRFLRYAKIQPHFEDARVVGFKITDIKPNSIFKKLGLKDGDIVTSLDGKKFRGTDEVIDYYRSLPLSTGMKLEIIREGEGKTIHYNFD